MTFQRLYGLMAWTESMAGQRRRCPDLRLSVAAQMCTIVCPDSEEMQARMLLEMAREGGIASPGTRRVGLHQEYQQLSETRSRSKRRNERCGACRMKGHRKGDPRCPNLQSLNERAIMNRLVAEARPMRLKDPKTRNYPKENKLWPVMPRRRRMQERAKSAAALSTGSPPDPATGSDE